jgi:hypothetical protein
MGTSIGQAIDYLVTLFGTGYTGPNIYQQTITVPSLTSIEPDVIIADTRPDDSGDVYVIVGRQSDQADSELTASAAYQVLGRQRITESYVLPGHILVLDQGPEQKPVRDRALALLDGVIKLVWADPTMGGILQDGRIGMVSEFTLSQPDSSTESQASAGGGVAASVSFGIQVENSYVP